jgi:3-oxoacyl-[acyl-carrier-protein] synthase-1
MTAPHPEGRGAAQAMRAALAEAGCRPEEIDFVAAHGTGTPDNDLSEAVAMRSVFGTVPPFCSMKRSLGHTLAASGILEAVFLLRAMDQGRIPATAGFEQYDEAVGAAPARPEDSTMRRVVKNAFGFGGNNASMVFGKG